MFAMAARTIVAFSVAILLQPIALSVALPTSWSALSSLAPTLSARTSHRENFIARDNCQAKVENSPWVLSNIAVIKTSRPDNLGSSICFNFFDSNQRSQLSTVCELTLTTETMSASPDGYFPCIQNQAVTEDTVSFSIDWTELGSIKVQRSYQDDCLGEPPYDHGNFFGSGNLDLSEPVDTVDGQYFTQARLEVPITSQD